MVLQSGGGKVDMGSGLWSFDRPRVTPAVAMAAALLGFCFPVSPGRAQVVNYYIELVPEKSANCQDRGGQAYTIELAAGKLSVYRPGTSGPMFTTTVPANGEVRQAYKSPAGGNMEFSGNVTTGQFMLFNRSTSCLYKLVGKHPEFRP
jgi:hypothetical protein